MEMLRKFREQRGLKQWQIAEKMGIHRVKYTKVESDYQKPDLNFIRSFTEAFNPSPKELYDIFISPQGSDIETDKPTGTEGG